MFESTQKERLFGGKVRQTHYLRHTYKQNWQRSSAVKIYKLLGCGEEERKLRSSRNDNLTVDKETGPEG